MLRRVKCFLAQYPDIRGYLFTEQVDCVEEAEWVFRSEYRGGVSEVFWGPLVVDEVRRLEVV